MDKAKPYPEIITSTTWKINEAVEGQQPKTDNINYQMTVPLGKVCEFCGVNHGRNVRMLQLGHAKWSPKTVGKLGHNTRLEAVEVLSDARIKWLLFVEKIKFTNDFICPQLIQAQFNQLLPVGSIGEIIMFLLKYTSWEMPSSRNSWYSTRYYSELTSSLIRLMEYYGDDMRFTQQRRAEYAFIIHQYHEVLEILLNRSRKKIIPFNRVKVAAKYLTVFLDELNERPSLDEIWDKTLKQQSSSLGSEAGEEDGLTIEDTAEDGANAASAGDTKKQLEYRMRKSLVEEMTYRSQHGMGRWGIMEIENPILQVNLNGKLKNGRGYRAMNYGHNPKYINRYCIDKQIFKQNHRVKGGTILIDASGSMRFNGEDILEIMNILPAVTIAMYNGGGLGGILRIIAKGGRRVTQDYLDKYTGGGNIVDGPALRWLAEMPARRIWESDMKVFGVGANSSGYNLLKDCYDICTQNKIINLKDIDEVKEHALKLNM